MSLLKSYFLTVSLILLSLKQGLTPDARFPAQKCFGFNWAVSNWLHTLPSIYSPGHFDSKQLLCFEEIQPIFEPQHCRPCHVAKPVHCQSNSWQCVSETCNLGTKSSTERSTHIHRELFLGKQHAWLPLKSCKHCIPSTLLRVTPTAVKFFWQECGHANILTFRHMSDISPGIICSEILFLYWFLWPVVWHILACKLAIALAKFMRHVMFSCIHA